MGQCIEDCRGPVGNVPWVIAAFENKDNSSATVLFCQLDDFLRQAEIACCREPKHRDRIVPMRVESDRNKNHLWFERLDKWNKDLICDLLIHFVPCARRQWYIDNSFFRMGCILDPACARINPPLVRR